MQTLPATPLWVPGKGVQVAQSRVIGPLLIKIKGFYQTNQCNDGCFDVLRMPGDTTCDKVTFRELQKLQGLTLRLYDELRRPPPPPKKRKQSRRRNDDGDDEEPAPEEEPPPEQPEDVAPPPEHCLEQVILSPVANSASDVFNILATNASNPRVSDYTGIGAFSYYFVTRGEARGICQEALDRILLDNRVRMGLVPRDKPPPKAVLEEMLNLRRSVEAQSDGTAFDMENCVFNAGTSAKQSKDWSLCFRDADDLGFMFKTLYDWHPEPGPMTTERIATLLTSCVDQNDTMGFYRLPPKAALAVRSGGDFYFGFHPSADPDGRPWEEPLCSRVLIALRPDPERFNFLARSSVKKTRFPRLRPPVGDVMEHVSDMEPFGFMYTDYGTTYGSNKEGSLGCFGQHAAKMLKHKPRDMETWHPAGTLVCHVRELALPYFK